MRPMLLSIKYCSVWNYLPHASSLEASLKLHFETLQVNLISSGGGVFEVSFDGELIFSKKSSGRFPTNSEIIDLVEKKIVWFSTLTMVIRK